MEEHAAGDMLIAIKSSQRPPSPPRPWIRYGALGDRPRCLRGRRGQCTGEAQTPSPCAVSRLSCYTPYTVLGVIVWRSPTPSRPDYFSPPPPFPAEEPSICYTGRGSDDVCSRGTEERSMEGRSIQREKDARKKHARKQHARREAYQERSISTASSSRSHPMESMKPMPWIVDPSNAHLPSYHPLGLSVPSFPSPFSFFFRKSSRQAGRRHDMQIIAQSLSSGSCALSGSS